MIQGQNSDRVYEKFTEENSEVKIYTNDGVYILKTLSEEIIETSFIPEKESEIKESHAVVLEPKKVSHKVKDSENVLE